MDSGQKRKVVGKQYDSALLAKIKRIADAGYNAEVRKDPKTGEYKVYQVDKKIVMV